ncbi:MAG: hypothetical protein ACM3ML_17990 [Micromonosporaceae bacterium]
MRLLFYRACFAAAAAAGLAISACGGSATGPSATSRSPAASPSASPTASPPAQSSPAQAPSSAPASLPDGYQPLFPFAGVADAQAWEASYRSGGHQPWHLSADVTATAFAAYLGYKDVDRVAHHTVSNGDAHVAVGYVLPSGKISTAAVVHLLRLGTGKYAPWEVVGTDDTTFTLDVPRYGSAVSSPVRVSGTITGVDENIRVQARGLSAGLAGTYCCRPAGGTKAPWSASVTFHASAGQVLTIAASTGGHVAAVERFAVTGIRAG